MANLRRYIVRYNSTAQRTELQARGRSPIFTGNVSPTGVAGAWTVAFSDEFTGTTLDRSKWFTNWGLSYEASDGADQNNVGTYTSNVSVVNGELRLQLSSTTAGASVHTGKAGTAGRFQLPVGGFVEARVYFPGPAPGTGAILSDGTRERIYNWPAWWVSGDNWPTNGENDIAEGLGGNLSANYHYGSSSATHVAQNMGTITGEWQNAFHVYGLHRKANSCDVYYDGTLVRSYATQDLGGGQELIFNVGASGSRTNIIGAAGALRVDYVRAWLPSDGTIPVARPNPPATFTATASTSDTTVNCTWTAAVVPPGGTAVTTYRIYDDTTGTVVASFGNVLAGTVTGLTGGNPYTLHVKAVNTAGESLKSPTATVTPLYTPPALSGGTIVRGPVKFAEASSATTVTVTKPTGLANGDVLVAVCGSTSIPAPAPSISGTGWTQQGAIHNTSTIAVWTKVVTDAATEPDVTLTGNTTAGRISGFLTYYRSVSAAVLDSTVVTATKATGVGSSLDVTAPTTGNTNSVLVGAVVGDFANTPTVSTPAAMTKLWESNAGGRHLLVADELRATAGAPGVRSFVESGAATAELNGVMFALRTAASGGTAAPTPVLSARWVGINTLSTLTTNATSTRIRFSTDSAGTTGITYSASATPDADGWSKHTASGLGLTAGGTYFYRVGMTNSAGAESFDTFNVGKIKLPPTGATSFAFNAFSCCNSTDSDSMAAITTRDDALAVHLGDMWYDDGAATTLASYKSHMLAKIQVANHQGVFSRTPTVYAPSDHDFSMSNNGNGGTTTTGRDNFNLAYRQMIANTPVPTTTGVYHTFTWGRVRFINLDCRSLASNPSATDNSSKSLLGATQKQWLKDTITASTEGLIVLLGDGPWIGTADPTGDDWTGYTTERSELASFFSASGKNICMVAGDMHAVAADSGTNSPGGIAVFHASPLNNNSSIKGGPYTNGPYPASGTAVVQQYGRFVVTDTGSDITLAYTGYSSDNTPRVTMSKVYTPPAGSGGGGGSSGSTITAGTTSSAEIASATSIGVTKPTGLATGQVMVASATFSSGATLSAPAGWTLIKQQGAGTCPTAMWYKVVADAAGEAATYTFTTNSVTAGRISAQITPFTGVDTTSPVDVVAVGAEKVAATTGNTLDVAGVTTVTAGALLIGAGSVNASSAVTVTGPASMTQVWHSTGTGRQHVFSTEAKATAGATGVRTWTETAGQTLEMEAILGALRPSGTPASPGTLVMSASAAAPTAGSAAVTLTAAGGGGGSSITAGTTSSAENASATSLAVTKPTGLANGQVMVASATFSSGATLSAPAGWTLIKQQGTGTCPTGMWYKVVTDAVNEAATYTFSTSSATAGRVSAQITPFTGVNTTTPIDVVAAGAEKVAGSAGNTLDVTGITTVTANALLIGAGGLNAASAATITQPASMTQVWHSGTTGRQHVFSTETQATAGASGTRTWTETTGQTLEMEAILGALRPA